MATNEMEILKRQNAELLMALRALATKATPGEWYHVGGHDQRKAPFIRVAGDAVPGTMAVAQICNRGSHSEYEANARWIAAANPTAIQPLLDYIAALEANLADRTPAADAAGLYQAALLAVERMRGCAATYIEDHARDTYPGQIGLRPQDVATIWAQEIHGIDAKAFLDEAIDDLKADKAAAADAGSQS